MKQWLAGILVLFTMGFISIWVPAPVAMAGLSSGGLQGGGNATLGGAQTISGAKTFSSVITSSVAAGSGAVTVLDGAYVCLNPGCTARINSNTIDSQVSIRVANTDRLLITAAGIYGSGVPFIARGGVTNDLANLSLDDNVIVRDRLVTSPQSGITVASDGAGTAAAFTITPTASFLNVTCNDTDGCTPTLSETGAVDGTIIRVNHLTANAVTYADTSGVSETAGAFAAGQYDTITFLYASDRWIELARSNN